MAALAAAIPGRKTLLATVTAIERWTAPDGQTRARVSYLRDQRLETVEAERVILAVPFVRLHQIRIDPPLSDDKWKAISSLDRGHYTVVHLLMDKGGTNDSGWWARSRRFPSDRRPARRRLRRRRTRARRAAAGGLLAADPRRRGGARSTWSRAR